MNINIAKALITNELNKHGLTDYTFKYNKSKSINGVCFYRMKRIELSSVYVKLNSFDRIYNTILHEVCHALDYRANPDIKMSHGETWKALCKKLGCNGNIVSQGSVRAEFKHLYQCTECNAEIGSYRLLKNIDKKFHKKCGKIKGKMIKVK